MNDLVPSIQLSHFLDYVCVSTSAMAPIQGDLWNLLDLWHGDESISLFACMILPGGGVRLQTSGGVKAQWFDSTLRAMDLSWLEWGIMPGIWLLDLVVGATSLTSRVCKVSNFICGLLCSFFSSVGVCFIAGTSRRNQGAQWKRVIVQ